MEESKCDYLFSPKELNTQKRDLFITYRSNSQNHYKDISSFNYDHRIRLNPSGEIKNMDIRNHIPINQIKDSLIKSGLFSPKIHSYTNKTAYEKDIAYRLDFSFFVVFVVARGWDDGLFAFVQPKIHVGSARGSEGNFGAVFPQWPPMDTQRQWRKYDTVWC